MSNLELQPDAVANENIKKNKTRESTAGQYQDLDLHTPENPEQYQELVTKQTSDKIFNNNPDITYENIKMEGQNKRGTKSEPEQRQYEELNTRNDRNDEPAYSELSLR